MDTTPVMGTGEIREGPQRYILQYAWWMLLSDPDFVTKYEWKPFYWGISASRYPVQPVLQPSSPRFDMYVVIISDLEHKCREEDQVLPSAKKNLERVYKTFVNSLLETHDAHCLKILDGAKPESDLWKSYSSTYMVPHGWLSRVDSEQAEKHPNRALAHDLVSSFMQESYPVKGKGELITEAGPRMSTEYASGEESLISPGSQNQGFVGGSSLQSHQDASSRVTEYLERLYNLVPPDRQDEIDASVVVGIAASVIATDVESLKGTGDYQSGRSASVNPNPKSVDAGTRTRPFWKDPVTADGTPDSGSENGSSGTATPTQESTNAAGRKGRLSEEQELGADLPWTFIQSSNHSNQGAAGTNPKTKTSITSMVEFS
jgi:hypothetical protein